jgi:hypothetical protein
MGQNLINAPAGHYVAAKKQGDQFGCPGLFIFHAVHRL